jgi:hypothetical protein
VATGPPRFERDGRGIGSPSAIRAANSVISASTARLVEANRERPRRIDRFGDDRVVPILLQGQGISHAAS